MRPFLWRLAHQHRLRGCVRNDGEGVLLDVYGSETGIDDLLCALKHSPPPLAVIRAIEVEEGTGTPPDDFRIDSSQTTESHTSVAADAATCKACLADILNPSDRRYRYPFTNCTECGPRLSIVRELPYDRANTSMASFDQCELCLKEYKDPTDRRFHAQPNACPECGPRVWLETDRDVDNGGDAIQQAARCLLAGDILAIKGIGGFHLVCDATCDEVVERLRQRKRRYHKPFALMATDVEMVAEFCQINPSSEALLRQSGAPIVVMAKGRASLPEAVAPGQSCLGFMLPYSPLHHLLMREVERPLVMTSGNASHEPQCIDNQEAREKLSEIADGFLMHDRDIVNREDDSVVLSSRDETMFLRRARGYAPQPMDVPPERVSILAMGAELKSTFCLLRDGEAILSQHLGDLEDASTWRDYRRSLQLYQQLYDFRPDAIVVDHHPDYLSSQWGRELAEQWGVPVIPVQHHQAHIAAVMVEHHLPLQTPVLGIALDGLGLGDDGGLWGSEFLLCQGGSAQRLAHFSSVPLLGGFQAMKQPWRNGLAYLANQLDYQQLSESYASLPWFQQIQQQPVAALLRLLERQLNCPMAASAARLFDALASLLGYGPLEVSYEGQAAIEMEAAASQHFDEAAAYDDGYEYAQQQLRWGRLFERVLADLQRGNPAALIAARCHRTIAAGVAHVAHQLCEQHGLQEVVASGGVMQNQLLRRALREELASFGRTLWLPSRVPANDGSIALGQAVIGVWHWANAES